MSRKPLVPKIKSRRFRKKLRIGKFQKLGFEISIVFNHQLESDKDMAFVIALIDEVIEPQGLSFGGGDKYGFITTAKCGSATEAHRASITEWLSRRKEVKSFQVFNLIKADGTSSNIKNK